MRPTLNGQNGFPLRNKGFGSEHPKLPISRCRRRYRGRRSGRAIRRLGGNVGFEASELLAAFGIRVGIDDPAPFAFPSCEADNVLDYGMTWSEGPFNVPLGAEGPELQSCGSWFLHR